MKIANIDGRAHLVSSAGGIDINLASDGKFPADLKTLIPHIKDIASWLESNPQYPDVNKSTSALISDLASLQSPITHPEQIFAIGLNYRAHGAEVAMAIPKEPMVFTKFPSCIAGPGTTIKLPADTVDWEIELVVVIGKKGRNIEKSDALNHIAGYCVGQDISERTLQLASIPPQFSIAKSFANFAPVGPWLTTPDEVDIDNLDLTCRGGGELLQKGNTRDLIFDIPTLISYLSSICELRIGDFIFTGTPHGVGMGRTPQKYLEDGWLLESEIEGLGNLSNPCSI